MTGTITIKMMSMTSNTSISGVTLISEEGPSPLEVPVVENAIAVVSQCRIGWASIHPYRHHPATKSYGRLANGHTAHTRA
jgi:hypothetical protein